jgi:hypothetical protein
MVTRYVVIEPQPALAGRLRRLGGLSRILWV